MSAELIETRIVNGEIIDLFGCYDPDTPPDQYEFYDAHLAGTGEHLNPGEPFYELPNSETLKTYL